VNGSLANIPLGVRGTITGLRISAVITESV
jgi:hypothetical protein